tara:strand:+ start:5757 stop:6095 length:339 start_codon:yes stop_codon:yes gene_type:complete
MSSQRVGTWFQKGLDSTSLPLPHPLKPHPAAMSADNYNSPIELSNGRSMSRNVIGPLPTGPRKHQTVAKYAVCPKTGKRILCPKWKAERLKALEAEIEAEEAARWNRPSGLT